MKIDRHELRNLHFLEEDVEKFEENVYKYLSSYTKRPQNLGRHYQKALNIAADAIVLRKPKEQIIRYLQLGLNLGIAHFISALELDEDYPITYEGKQYSYNSRKNNAYTGVADWTKLFYVALTIRATNAVNFLVEKISIKSLREAEVKSEEVDYIYVDALKALVSEDINTIGDHLVRTMDATDPELLPERKHSYVLEIIVPTLSVIESFLSNEPDRFHKQIEHALESHNYFWSKEDRAFNWRGWVSFPLLMVCALAVNSGFRVKIDSDYTPQWLVEWDWPHD